jgi:hypothetical protein
MGNFIMSAQKILRACCVVYGCEQKKKKEEKSNNFSLGKIPVKRKQPDS